MGLLDLRTLAAGGAAVFDLTNAIRMHVVPVSGATVTYSKVDSPSASSHDSDTTRVATSEFTVDADWPYYRVSTATQGCRVAVV